jgi:GNAT superfamily N-acetyltransferase
VDHAPSFYAQPTDGEIEEAFSAMLRQENAQAFIAYAAEEPIGYILLVVHERAANTFCRANRSLWIEQISVVPEWQRHGVGRRLVEATAKHARAVGLGTIMAESWTFNPNSHAFLQSLGFQEQSVRYRLNVRT